MSAENILVVAVDGLRAAALGAYGNTAYSTPALDQFATESLLFDWCFADAVELPTIYHSLWRGEASLLKSLADRGYSTRLVTDEPSITEIEAVADFHECVELTPTTSRRASDVPETELAALFAAGGEQIARCASGRHLVWIHSRGMYGAWDAPLELQEELLAREEGDPPPDDVLAPPDLWLDESSDPDTAFRWSCAYAAQVMVLDACLEGLSQTLIEKDGRHWLVVFLGVRGFPLGEHGKVGGVDGRLYSEQLHVPMLWRFVDRRDRLARNTQLVSFADLGPALLACTDGESLIPDHDALTALGPAGQRSIRTAEWSLVAAPSPESKRFDDHCRKELFVRPDDHWEANDVASLCPEIVELLLARIDAPPAS